MCMSMRYPLFTTHGLGLLSLAAAYCALAQFSGGFIPSNAPNGGFGGAAGCVASRSPVVFLHGNAGNAGGWSHPSSVDEKSPLDHFSSAGFTDCELFGLTWLSPEEQANQAGNFHQESKAQMVTDFIQDIISYTGKSQVVIIGHSMGVTVGLHSLIYNSSWKSVKTFLGISGAMLGLSTCLETGPANPAFPTCGSENAFDHNVFGFYPGNGGVLPNTHMALGSGFATYVNHSNIQFYTIRAGPSDEFVCPLRVECTSSLFDQAPNVKAQLMVGEGSPTVAPNGMDDSSGVGHFRSRANTGAIQVNMVAGCDGLSCCSGYNGNVCTL